MSKQKNKILEKVEIQKIKPNPDNPRDITESQLERLKKSIQEFPEMLELRPLILTEENIVLGGNMRLAALRALGYETAPAIYATNLTEEQKKEFIIKDNIAFGEWDWDKLANEWESNDLNQWGLDVWNPEFTPETTPDLGEEKDVTEEDMQKEEDNEKTPGQQLHAEVICPHCSGTFKVNPSLL